MNYGPANGEPERIDMFFLPDDFEPTTLGRAIPGSTFVVHGRFESPANIPALETYVVTHEMGHCLGLYHTFEFLLSTECSCDDYISDCCRCGDYVCDTKPHIGQFTWDSPCNLPKSVNLPGCTTTLTEYEWNNFMNYVGLNCANSFTNGQANRMRNIMTNDITGVTVPANTAGLYFNLEIASSVSWALGTFPNNEVLIYGTINVKSGGVLNIENGVVVKFARNSELVIEPNGLVNLNGVLTSMCEDYWQGVKIKGVSLGATNQYPLPNGQYQQGRIIAGGKSTINNSKIALSLSNGGQAICSGTTFKNNQTSIKITKYANKTFLQLCKITDLLGREINTFEVPANSTDFMLDLSRYTSGLYFWNLTDGKTQKKSGKIILSK